MLERAGARIVPFSFLNDAALPPGTRGIILSGGFPEVYAEALSRNAALYTALAPDGTPGGPQGAQLGDQVASYVHLHWLARPEMARRFVS